MVNYLFIYNYISLMRKYHLICFTLFSLYDNVKHDTHTLKSSAGIYNILSCTKVDTTCYQHTYIST